MPAVACALQLMPPGDPEKHFLYTVLLTVFLVLVVLFALIATEAVFVA